jgi:hypothetical protein
MTFISILTFNACNEYNFYSLIKLFEHMAYKYVYLLMTKFIIYIVKYSRITLNIIMGVNNMVITQSLSQ